MSLKKAVVLSRGGLASAVLASLLGKHDPARAPRTLSIVPSALREQRGLAPEGYALHLLTILDGQQPGPQARHTARLIAALLDASHEVLDPAALPWLPTPVSASPVARLCTLAAVVAVRQEAAIIAAGSTSEPPFVARFNQIAEQMGQVTELPRLQLLTPLAGSSDADLITLGTHLGVPLEAIWSCCAGFALPCGRCAACVARQAAFRQAGVLDRTRYRVLSVPQRAGKG